MIRLHIVTWLEVLGVLAGLISLGSIGMLVTPQGNPSRPLLPLLENQPERVIDDARAGYQVDTCVRDISPRTVLSEGASGASEFVVLEGAPVTECFPDLAEFAAHMREKNAGTKEENDVVPKVPGSDVRTSVHVLPPTLTETSGQPLSTSTISATATDVIAPTPTIEPPVPSAPLGGSSGGGSGGPATQIPPVDVFDACMKEIFGQVVPKNPTPEEVRIFEECLLRNA